MVIRKKILFFIGGSYVSGLETVTLYLLRDLKENGYDLQCVINGWNDGVFKKKLDEIDVPFYEVKLGWLYLRKPLWTLDSLVNYPKAYFTCKEIIKSFKPDIFHFCGYHNVIMLYPLIRKESIYGLHETHLPSLKHKLIYRLLNKKIRDFTAVSGHIKTVLQHLSIPEKKIHVVYNGIPVINELPGEKTSAFIKGSILEFAIIGQVAEWKGHSILLRAVEKLIANCINDFKVVVYGNDNNVYGNSLKKQIKELQLEKWFEWRGFISSKEEIYDTCAVVIVPSLSEEPCSMTIIEAMSRAKALIVSDRGGNPELIEHARNGLVFKGGDDISLSFCMQTLLENRNRIPELGNEARLKAMREYSSKKMTDKYISIYNNALPN